MHIKSGVTTWHSLIHAWQLEACLGNKIRYFQLDGAKPWQLKSDRDDEQYLFILISFTPLKPVHADLVSQFAFDEIELFLGWCLGEDVC